jgi:AcrR family transcriptional regulator
LAGVALPTLTGYFPNKAALLKDVLRAVVSGATADEQPPIRDQLKSALAISDPAQLLAAVATVFRIANERACERFEIMRKAAAADPTIGQRRHSGAEDRRRENWLARTLTPALLER